MKPLEYDARNILYLDIINWINCNTSANLNIVQENNFGDFFDTILEPYTTGDYSNYN